MKSFFSHLAGIKTAACLCYTASMLAYGAVCLAMGLEAVGVMMVFQLGLVCLLCGAIQYILFSGAVVRAMSYGRRVALALPAFLAVAAGAGVLFSWFPMFLAMLLNEVRNRYWKNGIQTVITIPNFVSWVIVYALCFSIFSTEGLYNQLFHTNNTLLTNKDTIWYFMEGLTLWKSAGWNSIIYLAAITGIDESLYEAAMVDGANRFQSALHITLPSLMSTFIVVLLLQIGSFMSAGFDQYFAFSNIMVQSKLEVIDLYTYRIGMKTMDYSFATAISILQSIVSVALLMLVNGFSRLTRGEGII